MAPHPVITVMKPPGRPFFSFTLKPLCVCMFAMAEGAFPAICQSALTPPGDNYPISAEVRLSHWLAPVLLAPAPRSSLIQPYPTALMWLVDEEKNVQSALKNRLLEQLRNIPRSPKVTEQDRRALLGFVESLPITGRVVLKNTDPRWLEVHPEADPVLLPGQTIVIPSRPQTVSVLKPNGEICRIHHIADHHAQDYIRQCDATAAPQFVWIIQPDGIVQRHGTAHWNSEKQDRPAPGAWILADHPDMPWHWSALDHLAFFLATQGPAPDGTIVLTHAQTSEPPPKNLPLTNNDWGGVGLLQMPSARMAPAGEAAIGLSQTPPYTRLNFTLQPFNWMETSFRYVDVSNRLYGEAIAGSQSYKDKSVDIKLRLSKETRFMPQIAVGVRDITGTGLFAGEYVVASKRTGNFDWTLGLGWGNVGGRGDLPNPLSFLGSGFKTRPTETESATSGGEANFSTLFHGPTALFGGVQYQTPWENLVLKLEYDGNDYQHEAQNNHQKQRTPFNLGAVYRYSPVVDLSLGVERGDTALFGINFHGPLNKLHTDKLFDPPMPPIEATYPNAQPDWTQTARTLERQSQWRVTHIKHAGSELIVRFDEVDAGYWGDRLDRITAVLHRDAPQGILVFRIQSIGHGLKLNEYLIDRKAWVEAKTQLQPPHIRKSVVFEKTEENGFLSPRENTVFHAPVSPLNSKFGLNYSYQMGGPDGFILHQLSATGSGVWKWSANTWTSGEIRARLLDNYDKFKYTAPSNLPRVRTYVREFLTSSEVTLPNLQLTHVGQLGASQFYSVYGGLLESMYGGVGGEWLYRPMGSPFALGVDINAVRQRAFEQDLGFRDYQVATGHTTLYWDTGFQGVQAEISAGRYLAGDVGITVDLSREFSNGVRMGAFATKTNVSAEQFGEGSFDKGIYVKMPFDAFLPRSSSTLAGFFWHPLLRDGGAKLERKYGLFNMTKGQSGQTLKWRPFGGESTPQLADIAYPQYAPKNGIALFDRPLDAIVVDDIRLLGKAAIEPSFWGGVLTATGVTLASSLLDKSADQLARDYGGRNFMKGVETLGDLLPFAAFGLSGIAALSGHDAALSKASLASLEAGSAGLGLALLGKYAVGRARPETEQGPGKLTPFSSNNSNSSFPSVHTTLAWATLTPYAKAYNAPWLYGAAALTNVARVSGRKHWFSDTVGGAFLGYSLGSLFWEDRNRPSKQGPKVHIGPGVMGLEWETP